MKNLKILYILLIFYFILSIISCANNEDNMISISRSLLFRTNNDGILEISSDGSSWMLSDSEKTKDHWSDVLKSVKSKFRLFNR